LPRIHRLLHVHAVVDHVEYREQHRGGDAAAALRLRGGLRVELSDCECCGEQEFGEQIEFHDVGSILQ